MIILGIDPALNKLGFCIIEVIKDNYNLKYINTLKITGNKSEVEKIKIILDYLKSLIEKFEISLLCVESQFVNLNVKTSLGLSTVKGALIAYGIFFEKDIIEVNPKEVKKYITGNGNADKLQVAKMINLMLKKDIKFNSEDESDAVAIAITGFYKKNNNIIY